VREELAMDDLGQIEVRHRRWLPAAYLLAAIFSVLLVLAHRKGWLPVPLDTTELLAFVTGAWGVWLVVRNNPWNWPIGVANSAFFVALFWEARLFFDMGLNVFYVASGLWGWWIWQYGGERRTEKPIGSVGAREALAMVGAGLLLTLVMWHGGILIEDAAPFLDALTTGLSVVAQWLLMRRLIESWYAWIAVDDLIYVPLYLSRGLPLTAVLYALFLLLCLRGLVEWRATVRRQRAATTLSEALA
jgi:nicotinamide mononucleotide transporter